MAYQSLSRESCKINFNSRMVPVGFLNHGYHLCVLFLIIGYFRICDAQCSFPPDLTGVWISADKGTLTFTNETLSGYPTKGVVSFFQAQLALDCKVLNGDKYILKSQQQIDVWGRIASFFLCMELHYVQENIYYYYIGTNYDFFAADQLLGHATDDGLNEACNRAEPYNTGSFIMLVKDGMVDIGNASSQCPDNLLAKFESVTITNDGGTTEYCADTTLDVCTDRTVMNYTYNDTCTNVKTYSDGGIYTCMHAISEGSVTYVAVWNNDDTVDNSNTYRFTCYAVAKVGGIVYATEAPRFCNDTDQTPYVVGELNGGNVIVLTTITVVCPDVDSTTRLIDTTTSSAGDTQDVFDDVVSPDNMGLLGLLVLFLLIPLIIGIILLIHKYGCKKRSKKPVIPKQKEIDLGKGDQNSKRTLQFHSYQQPEDTKTLVPMFKPKKPILVSPVFDPNWKPSKLPFLAPLAKVEPLYQDTIEDYLSSRMPRRPSHISLYSFDSIIFASDP